MDKKIKDKYAYKLTELMGEWVKETGPEDAMEMVEVLSKVSTMLMAEAMNSGVELPIPDEMKKMVKNISKDLCPVHGDKCPNNHKEDPYKDIKGRG